MKSIRTWPRTKTYRTKRSATGWHVMNLTHSNPTELYVGYMAYRTLDEIMTQYACLGYTHYEIVGNIITVDKRS